MLVHELKSEFHLSRDFRVVRRQQKAIRSFRGEQDVALLQLQSIEKFLGEDDAVEVPMERSLSFMRLPQLL